jgi:hypothetical protein
LIDETSQSWKEVKMSKAAFVFRVDGIVVDIKKGSGRHDSDWLILTWTVNEKTFQKPPFHIGDNIDGGQVIDGPWASDPIEVGNSDIVTVTYVVVNLSALDTDEQAKKAIELGGKIAASVAPIFLKIVSGILAAAGSIAGTPGAAVVIEGASAAISNELSSRIASVINDLMVPFVKDVVEFVVEVFEGPNCNGEVLRSDPNSDALIFPPGEFKRAAYQPSTTREYAGPQENSKCSRPRTKVTFSIEPSEKLEAGPHSGNFIQSTLGIQSKFRGGNFELVAPQGDHLTHFSRLNNDAGFPWVSTERPPEPKLGGGAIPTNPTAVSIIQGNFNEPGNLDEPGNLEMIVRMTPVTDAGGQEDTLASYFFENSSLIHWKGPFPVVADGKLISGVTGNIALIQSTCGTKGNFELLVPRGNRVMHYFRDNDAPGFPWRRGGELPTPRAGGGALPLNPTSVSMIQSNFNDPGNLEAIVRFSPVFDTGEGGTLAFYFRDSQTLKWFGPDFFKVEGRPITGVTGNPALIQNTKRTKGNFEILVPQGNHVVHYFRENDTPGFPWRRGGELPMPKAGGGALPLTPTAVSLIQSNFNNPGNLEAILRFAPTPDNGQGDILAFFFRDSLSGQWSTPDFFKVNGQPITGVTGF